MTTEFHDLPHGRAGREPLQVAARSVDNEAPYFVDMVGQEIAEKFPGLTPLKKRARAYVDENVFVGIINDPLAGKLRHEIGINRIMWGSDFPHPPCPYPHTRQRIGEILGDIPAAERTAMTSGNVSKLYGIDLSKLDS